MSTTELELLTSKLVKALVAKIFSAEEKDALLENYLLIGTKGYRESSPEKVLEDYGHYILGYGDRVEVGKWVVSKDKDGFVTVRGFNAG